MKETVKVDPAQAAKVCLANFNRKKRRLCMALVDKMKAQAAQLAQKAQEAGKAGQSKLADAQARRRADGLLRELGAAFYAQKTGTAKADNAGEIDRLIGELKSYEADYGSLAGSDSTNAADPSSEPTKDDTPPEGGFKL
jgi:hypothetical protein